MTSDEWIAKLAAQAQMPRCAGASAVRTGHQAMGQDYSNTLTVTGPAACIALWYDSLRRSNDYHCEGVPLSCTRYDEKRRFDEEWATVAFVAVDRAEVRLTKI